MSNTAKHVIDAATYGGTIAALAGWLPPIAAFMSILWIAYQFWHSAPFVAWRKSFKNKGEPS